MQKIYKPNGLLVRDERDIILRDCFEKIIKSQLEYHLKKINRAFEFIKIEASQITPLEYINENYTTDDYYDVWENLVLRPETTMWSYEYAKYILNPHNKPKYNMPIVVRQHWKSFRKEQDKTLENMRLKEFYQLEFQIIYSESTSNDYHTEVVEIVRWIINAMVWDCYTIPSDRLPNYSEKTTDIQMSDNDMEVSSISLRKDYPWAKVVEVAIGTDRLIYNFNLNL